MTRSRNSKRMIGPTEGNFLLRPIKQFRCYGWCCFRHINLSGDQLLDPVGWAPFLNYRHCSLGSRVLIILIFVLSMLWLPRRHWPCGGGGAARARVPGAAVCA